MAEEKARVETLYDKIANIRETVEAIQKNKQGYGYKYVSEDEVLAKVSAGLKKYQIDVYPRIVPNTMQVVPYTAKKNKVLKDGTILEDCINEIIVSAEMEFEWVNLENPEDKIIIPWTIVGQQSDASQAFGSGLTYCMRYFYLKFFKTATVEDDPDNWRSKQKEALEQENKAAVEKAVSEGRPVPYTKEAKQAEIGICEKCGKKITDVKQKDGTIMNSIAVEALARSKTGKSLCADCLKGAKK